MNTASSRSHLISTFFLDIKNKSKGTTACGKIMMVDLAGSERLKKSEVTGDQMKEALAINKRFLFGKSEVTGDQMKKFKIYKI